MKNTTTAYSGQVGEPKTTYVLQLEAENAALRARVEELEANVRDYENYVWGTAELRALRGEGVA